MLPDLKTNSLQKNEIIPQFMIMVREDDCYPAINSTSEYLSHFRGIFEWWTPWANNLHPALLSEEITEITSYCTTILISGKTIVIRKSTAFNPNGTTIEVDREVLLELIDRWLEIAAFNPNYVMFTRESDGKINITMHEQNPMPVVPALNLLKLFGSGYYHQASTNGYLSLLCSIFSRGSNFQNKVLEKLRTPSNFTNLRNDDVDVTINGQIVHIVPTIFLCFFEDNDEVVNPAEHTIKIARDELLRIINLWNELVQNMPKFMMFNMDDNGKIYITKFETNPLTRVN